MIPSHHRLACLLATGFGAIWLGAVGLTLASARLPEATSGRVLAVFPPGLDGAAVSARIIDAGGIPLEPYGAGFAWTAYARAEGFVGRLHAQGAVLVIPPLGDLRFPGICGAGMELLASRSGFTPAVAP